MAEVEERPIVGSAGAGALNLGGLNPVNAAAYKQYTGKLESSDKRIDAIQQEQQKAGEMKEVERKKALAERAAAEEKGAQTQPLPDAPKFSKTELSQGPQLLMALAAFSGLVSRQPLTASLNALAGVITGIHNGDVETFEKHYREYEGNYRKASETNRQAIAEFDKLMKRKDLSISEIDRELDHLNVKFGMKVSQELKYQQGVGKSFEAWEKLKQAQDKNNQFAQTLAEHHQHNQDMKAARAAAGGVKPMTENQAFNAEMAVEKPFLAEGKPLNKMRRTLDKIETLMSTDTAQARALVKSSMVELSELPRATNYMIKLGMNPGNLPERVFNHLSEFATGKTTATFDKELLDTLRDLNQNFVDPSLQAIQKNYEQVHADRGLKQNPRRLFSTAGDIESAGDAATEPASGAPMSLDAYLKSKGH